MKNILQGKTAVITGGTKGIGRYIAGSLAKAGANIVVSSRHQDECDTVAEELAAYNVETLGIQADITAAQDREHLFSAVLQQWGTLDILVNNAGCAFTKKAEDITEEDWDQLMNLNLKAAFFCAQEAGKIMIPQGNGKIINISSVLGLVAEKQVVPYCISKSGILQMTKALALEWAKYNIQVNAVCPGYIKTELNQDVIEKSYAYFMEKIPMRRLAAGEEIGAAVVYLSSEQAAYMTGQQLVLDGGWTLA